MPVTALFWINASCYVMFRLWREWLYTQHHRPDIEDELRIAKRAENWTLLGAIMCAIPHFLYVILYA